MRLLRHTVVLGDLGKTDGAALVTATVLGCGAGTKDEPMQVKVGNRVVVVSGHGIPLLDGKLVGFPKKQVLVVGQRMIVAFA